MNEPSPLEEVDETKYGDSSLCKNYIPRAATLTSRFDKLLCKKSKYIVPVNGALKKWGILIVCLLVLSCLD